jgi:hypothetical protein
MANNTGKSHNTEVPINKKYHLKKLPREHKATFYNNKQDTTECLRATRHPSISVGQRYNKPPTLQNHRHTDEVSCKSRKKISE